MDKCQECLGRFNGKKSCDDLAKREIVHGWSAEVIEHETDGAMEYLSKLEEQLFEDAKIELFLQNGCDVG